MRNKGSAWRHLALARLAIGHRHRGIAIVVAADLPFKAKRQERGPFDDEVARRHGLVSARAAGQRANSQQCPKKPTHARCPPAEFQRYPTFPQTAISGLFHRADGVSKPYQGLRSELRVLFRGAIALSADVWKSPVKSRHKRAACPARVRCPSGQSRKTAARRDTENMAEEKYREARHGSAKEGLHGRGPWRRCWNGYAGARGRKGLRAGAPVAPAPINTGKQTSSVDLNYKPRRFNKVIELWEDGQPAYYTTVRPDPRRGFL